MISTLPFRLNSYIVLGMGVITIGFSAIFVRQAAAPGTITAFYRVAIALLVMTVPFLLHLRRTQGTRLSPQGILMAILGGVFFALDLSLWSTGVVMSGATTPTLMANTAPLWVGLGAMLFFREYQTTKFWMGLVLALAGATIVMGEDLSHSINFGVGTFLGLLAAIFYGAYHLVSQRGRSNLSTIAYFWITTLCSTITLLMLNIFLRQPFTGYSTSTYLNFLLLGVIVQAFGWIMINYVQGHLPASIVAPTLLGQPVVTALFAWLLLGETLTSWHFVGGVLVLVGVYIVHRSRHKVYSNV